jgi:hypothetical protein
MSNDILINPKDLEPIKEVVSENIKLEAMKQKILIAEKSNRVKSLFNIFDFNSDETYDNLFHESGISAYTIYLIYKLGFMKKSRLVALLDELDLFDEALEEINANEFEEWISSGMAKAEGFNL